MSLYIWSSNLLESLFSIYNVSPSSSHEARQQESFPVDSFYNRYFVCLCYFDNAFHWPHPPDRWAGQCVSRINCLCFASSACDSKCAGATVSCSLSRTGGIELKSLCWQGESKSTLRSGLSSRCLRPIVLAESCNYLHPWGRIGDHSRG